MCQSLCHWYDSTWKRIYSNNRNWTQVYCSCQLGHGGGGTWKRYSLTAVLARHSSRPLAPRELLLSTTVFVPLWCSLSMALKASSSLFIVMPVSCLPVTKQHYFSFNNIPRKTFLNYGHSLNILICPQINIIFLFTTYLGKHSWTMDTVLIFLFVHKSTLFFFLQHT